LYLSQNRHGMPADPILANCCSEVLFKKLFFEHARRLRNYLYFRCGDPALADDLVQDAFLELWRHCEEVPYPQAKRFLFKVATNRLLDTLKKRQVEQRYLLHQGKALPIPDGQFALEEKEFRQRLERALYDLPESQRMVFLLNRVEKMTYRSMADFLGLSVKAIERRMHLALDQLRRVFHDQPAGPW